MSDTKTEFVTKTNKDKKSNSSLHSQEIKENLDSVNMDAWFYIYENYVNPPPKKEQGII